MTPITPLTPVLPIGYSTLRDLALALDPTSPVYLAPLVETTHGGVAGERTDHHFIVVTQPDSQNRIHYCRIPVVQLVYLGGIAFAPDYAEQLAQIDVIRQRVATWLVEQGYTVHAGMAGLPVGYTLIEGRLD